MDWFDFIVLGLATQRLTFIWLTQAIMSWPRSRLSLLGGFIQRAINCGVCMSVWFGAVCYALFIYGGPLGQATVYVFAIASLSAAIQGGLFSLGAKNGG